MGLAPGQQVDRYVLEERLGAGGQGEVWRARDPLFPGRSRALKLVSVARTSAAQLERVRREARQLVQLQHPSLVECIGLFEDLHHDVLGIAMEFVEAQPLDELVDDARLDDRKRLCLVMHVGHALAYVHQRNVVHRDVKLENVLLARGFWDQPDDPATVKLIDFGIAVPSANPEPLTQVGHVIGTPPYLAPELLAPGQWGGSGGASAPADVFAFGVLVWKLLAKDAGAHPTGLPPRARLDEYAATYWRARSGPWPGLPAGVTGRWSPLLERALALSPRDRAQNGLELLRSVAEVDPSVVVRTAEQTAPTPLLGSLAVDADKPPAPVTEPHTASVNVQPHGVTPQPAVRTIPAEPPVLALPGAQRPGPAPRGSERWVGVAVLAGVLGFGGFLILLAAAGFLAFRPSASSVSPSASLGEPNAADRAPRAARSPAEPSTAHAPPRVAPSPAEPQLSPPSDPPRRQVSSEPEVRPGDVLEPDSEWLFRINGAVIVRASPTNKRTPSSFPEQRNERLCVQVRRTSESCCIDFGATGCSVAIRAGDLVQTGMGLTATFYRDDTVILKLAKVRFPSTTLRYAKGGYALPLEHATVVSRRQPPPWGESGWASSINGFLERHEP